MLTTQLGASHTGTDTRINHQTSDTYGVSLMNQDNVNIPGPAGNLVFAIYNTARSPTYVVSFDSCWTAMLAPLVAFLNKGPGGNGDRCYGSKNNDYEGGYYSVDGVGVFGSEVTKS
jgi:hypothetical protein